MTYNCKTGKFTIDGNNGLVVKNQTKPFYGTEEYEKQEYNAQMKKNRKRRKTGTFIWAIGFTNPNSFKWCKGYRGIHGLDQCVRMGADYTRPETFNLSQCSISYDGKSDDRNVFITENDAKRVLGKKRWFSYNGREYESTLKDEGYEIVKLELPEDKLDEYYDAVKAKVEKFAAQKEKLLEQVRAEVNFYDSEIKFMTSQLERK